MIRGLISLYSWHYPTTLVYMLQNTEYYAGPYLKWYWQTIHFERVRYRRQLAYTKPARLLLLALRLGILAQLTTGAWLIWQGVNGSLVSGVAFGLAVIVAYPVLWAHLIVLPLELGRLFIVKPRQNKAIRRAKPIFAGFKGTKIAIAGSYGKTSMKELLTTVLSEAKNVASTPANKNVAISHAGAAHKILFTK